MLGEHTSSKGTGAEREDRRLLCWRQHSRGFAQGTVGQGQGHDGRQCIRKGGDDRGQRVRATEARTGQAHGRSPGSIRGGQLASEGVRQR